MTGLMCSLCGEPVRTHTHFKGLLDLWRTDVSAPILKYFEFKHLPAYLQDISAEFHDLAHKMDADQADSAEKSAGLRKLLEAKDCFVRNALP